MNKEKIIKLINAETRQDLLIGLGLAWDMFRPYKSELSKFLREHFKPFEKALDIYIREEVNIFIDSEGGFGVYGGGTSILNNKGAEVIKI